MINLFERGGKKNLPGLHVQSAWLGCNRGLDVADWVHFDHPKR